MMSLHTETIMIKLLWSGVKLLDGKKLKEVMPWTLLHSYICFSDINLNNILWGNMNCHTVQRSKSWWHWKLFKLSCKSRKSKIDNKKTKYMLLKLWGRFCTPAVVHTSYFDCVMKATAWKVKVANMFAMLIIWRNIQKKKFSELQFLWENESN